MCNGNRDDGFTLIELAVVVMIIAVLVAIGIPNFTGFSNRAHDGDAQADLRGTLLVETVYHLDNSEFTETTSTLTLIEPLIDFNVAGDPEGTVRVRTETVAEDGVCFFTLSRSGQWWAMYRSNTDATHYGQSAPAPCNAALASTWSTDGW